MANTFRKTETEQDVYTAALDRVRLAYDMFDDVVVSFSGGKDSTATLQVTLKIARELGRLPVKVMFVDEEAIHPETIAYVERVAALPDVELKWFCVPVQHRNACSPKAPYWYPWAAEDEARWCRPMPDAALREDALGPGFDRQPMPELNRLFYPELLEQRVCFMLGIRASESLKRYRLLASRTHLNWIHHDGCRRRQCKHEHCGFRSAYYLAKPIYDWKDADVWTAPGRFGWDYNTTYDLMRNAGVQVRDQRVCPPYGEQPLKNLYTYAICWPELWAKMVRRVPGAATAARYAHSPLYGFNELPGWDDDVDPQALIREALLRWPAEQRHKIERKLDQLRATHYQKAPGQPIPRNPPSDSGVSWYLLYATALQGDLKNRRTLTYTKEAIAAARRRQGKGLDADA